MSILLHGDCLEELINIDDKSIDLIFCDLPYGQTSCKWDSLIDLDKLWIEIMRIKKLNTPIIMTCTTKFGVNLIQSAPKKCPFRYDLVWCKSASAGFLSAKKMPLRKHELIYFFYEKLPFYDLSSHKHKFIDKEDNKNCETAYGNVNIKPPKTAGSRYDPPLPDSLVKEGGMVKDFTPNKNGNIYDCPDNQEFKGRNGKPRYEPPLPNSLIKEGGSDGSEYNEKYTYKQDKEKDLYGTDIRKETRTGKAVGKSSVYEPPLPNSLVKVDKNIGTIIKDTKLGTNTYDTEKRKKPIKRLSNDVVYEPPLPHSLIKEGGSDGSEDVYQAKERFKNGKLTKNPRHLQKGDDPIYDPPLPNSLLEIKSTRGKHSTEKPVSLMSWILKYYSKEGDTILDPTMGSGSMGVACKEMNRNFIGIEKDPEIYEVAVNRIEN